MALVKHETCQQYVARRLSEGWGIVWQQGYHLILSSPEGIIRPIDLRNDVETLRPNAGGNETALLYWDGAGHGPDPLHNFEQVYEVTPDEDSTYVYVEGLSAYKKDLYNIPNPGLDGIIHSVKIYFRCRETGGAGAAFGYIRTHDTTYDAGTAAITTSYVTYDFTWLNNPNTTNPWTWAEIDALEIGVGISASVALQDSHCTQVYIEVDYTPAPPAPPAKPPTFRLDPKPRTRARFYPNLQLG